MPGNHADPAAPSLGTAHRRIHEAKDGMQRQGGETPRGALPCPAAGGSPALTKPYGDKDAKRPPK